MDFWRKYGFILHSIFFVALSLLSVYGIVSVMWHEFNLNKWGNSTKVFAFLLSSAFILPIIAAIVNQLTSKK